MLVWLNVFCFQERCVPALDAGFKKGTITILEVTLTRTVCRLTLWETNTRSFLVVRKNRDVFFLFTRGTHSMSPDKTDHETNRLTQNVNLKRYHGTARCGTALDQWEMVEAWMARARRSLGPKAWDCLGLSSAFHRTRNQIRQYLVLGDDENQSPVSHGGRSPPADAGSPQRSWMMDSEKVAPDRGRRAKDGQMGRANSRLNQARKRGTLKGGRTEEKGEAKEQGGKVGEVVSSGWDRHLCEKASLAINAVMWTIATERERSTYCTIFAAEEGDIATTTDGGGREALPTGNATAQQQAAWGTDNVCAGRATTEDSNPATTAELELRVSLAAARRFIKSSRLIDGVFVLDADVDLAFKRWEEVGRLAGRDQQRSRSTETTTCRSPIRRGVKGKGTAEPSFTDVNASVPPNQKLCEAVGCSDPALYGDVHPLAKAILCRKHRRNGMVDVGSRR